VLSKPFNLLVIFLESARNIGMLNGRSPFTIEAGRLQKLSATRLLD